MTQKILFVDDDPHLLAALERNLRKEFTLDCAIGPREALESLQKRGPYAVIVADMRMPGMDGATLLEHFHRLSPDTVRVMLTGNPERQTVMDAINRGQAFRFLSKPCPPDVLVPALRASLRQHQLVCAERELLEGTLAKSVHALVEILGLAVPEAHGRGQTLRDAVRELAVMHNVGPFWELELAAELSLIGYASLPHEVLRKLHARVPLSFDEQSTLDRVPQVGHDLLSGIPRLENVARIVLLQHKNFDGSGFPHIACAGTEIPLGARWLKILEDRLALEAQGVSGSVAKHEMVQRTGCYDADWLEKIFDAFPGLVARLPDGEKPPLALNLDELLPGQRLYADLKVAGGLALATRGQRITSMMIVRLRNLAEIGEVHEPFLIHDEPGATAALAQARR